MNEDYLFNLDLAGQLDMVYSRFFELTDGEEDDELREYNEWCLGVLERSISYIYFCDKRGVKYRDEKGVDNNGG